jgi:hypothetical protein
VSDVSEGTLRKDKIYDLIGQKKLVNWGKKKYPAKILNIGELYLRSNIGKIAVLIELMLIHNFLLQTLIRIGSRTYWRFTANCNTKPKRRIN